MTKLVTEEGLKNLKDELTKRKTEIRQKIAKAIKEAKEQGDLSENAEYSEAKRQQAENETRIAKLESMVKNFKVVKKSKNSMGVVEIGSSVSVKFNSKEMIFHIVGSSEADPSSLKVSNESPIGRAFIGKKKGDVVKVETPGGVASYKILEVN